jgi:NADPH:quinone reductase
VCTPWTASVHSGKYARLFGTTLPFIPGFNLAGVVEKTGNKITKFKPGDAVHAMIDLKDGGGYSEYAIATEIGVALKPSSLNYVEAAALPGVALAAWQALVDTAKPGVGQTVLIHGG